MDAELGHEAGDHAEKTDPIVVSVLYEVVEAIDAKGCPVALRLDDEISLTSLEFDPEVCWCGLRHASAFRLQEWRLFFPFARVKMCYQQTQRKHHREHKADLTDGQTD
jgi:hypothetical protein